MVEILMLIVAIFAAIITFFAWRISQRVAWLTGAMESHSSIMLMIEAKRGINGQPIKNVWWDPTIETTPGGKEHNKDVELNCIYSYLPLTERKSRPNRFVRWLHGEPN